MNMSGGGSIQINGKTIRISGSRIYVDGKEFVAKDGASEPSTRTVRRTAPMDRTSLLFGDEPDVVETEVPSGGPYALPLDGDGRFVGDIEGDIYVTGGGTLIIEGTVNGSVEADGNVTVSEAVGGSARSSGNLNCGMVGGSARAGGNLNCGMVGGSARAGGDINHG